MLWGTNTFISSTILLKGENLYCESTPVIRLLAQAPTFYLLQKLQEKEKEKKTLDFSRSKKKKK
jgi:hypothetical protein